MVTGVVRVLARVGAPLGIASVVLVGAASCSGAAECSGRDLDYTREVAMGDGGVAAEDGGAVSCEAVCTAVDRTTPLAECSLATAAGGSPVARCHFRSLRTCS